MSDFFSNPNVWNGLGAIAGGIFGGSPNAPQAPTFSSNMDNPYFYQPNWQGGADRSVQGLYGNFGQYQGANQFNPYTSVQPGLAQYYAGMQNNPYASQVQAMANWASPEMSQVGNQSQFGGNQIYQAGMAGLGIADQLRNETYNFQYAIPMIQGAQQGGNALMGVGQDALQNAQGLAGLASNYASPLTQFAGQGAQGLQGLAQSTTQGLMPYAQQQASQLPGLASSYAQPGNAAAMSLLNTAFDPQGQLYTQQFQQNQDQTRAALAARGIDTSGTGAGIENQSNQNFNTNWLNQQLGRQQQGLSAYDANAQSGYGMQSSAGQQGLNSLLSAAQGTFSPYSSAYGQGVSGLNTAATTGYGLQSGAMEQAHQLGAAGAGDIISGSAAPWQASENVFNNQISQLQGLGGLTSTYGNQAGYGNQMEQTGLGQRMNSNLLPYQTSTSLLGDQFLGAQNYLNAGSTGIGNTGAASGINNQQIQALLNYLSQGTNSANSYAGALNTNFGNQVSLYQAQLDAARNKSGGIGSLFGGLGNIFSSGIGFL